MGHIFNLKRDKADPRDIKFRQSISPHPDVVIPSKMDLRSKCPPAYDQGDLGSCTANAGCACRVITLGQSELQLSRLFLYYEERTIEKTVKEDSGASLRDTCKVMNKVGVCEEKYMPYDIEKFDKPPSRDALMNAQKYRVSAYKSLDNLNEIKQSIALTQQPILIGMDVYESFEGDAVAKTGIMPMPRASEKKFGGHAVLVVGYMDNPRYGLSRRPVFPSGYLIVRNSWGEKWGDKGYFYMPYEYLTPDYTYDYWVMGN